MHISTKGRYGLRAVLDLAYNCSDKPVTLSAIASRQSLSEGYLEQLMTPLRKAEIIVSTRGAQGGYALSRSPETIYIGQVFRALEGPLSLVSCIGEEPIIKCRRRDICGSAFIWEKVQDAISDVLDQYTVADLINREASLSSYEDDRK